MPPKGKKTPTRSKSPKKQDDAASKPEVSYFATNLNEVRVYPKDTFFSLLIASSSLKRVKKFELNSMKFI